jgi:hypothetical protein
MCTPSIACPLGFLDDARLAFEGPKSHQFLQLYQSALPFNVLQPRGWRGKPEVIAPSPRRCFSALSMTVPGAAAEHSGAGQSSNTLGMAALRSAVGQPEACHSPNGLGIAVLRSAVDEPGQGTSPTA